MATLKTVWRRRKPLLPLLLNAHYAVEQSSSISILAQFRSNRTYGDRAFGCNINSKQGAIAPSRRTMNGKSLLPKLAVPVERTAIGVPSKGDRGIRASQWWQTSYQTRYGRSTQPNTRRLITSIVNAPVECDPNQIYCTYVHWDPVTDLPRNECMCQTTSGGVLSPQAAFYTRWVPSEEVPNWTAKGWKAIDQTATTGEYPKPTPAYNIPQATPHDMFGVPAGNRRYW